jgi:hypothetical protein
MYQDGYNFELIGLHFLQELKLYLTDHRVYVHHETSSLTLVTDVLTRVNGLVS